MTAFMNAFPRKSSLTRTHAVSVPSTAFTADTTNAAPRVSFNAATDSGELATDQKSSSPFAREAHTRAAIGRTTMTVRNIVVKPSERAAGAPSLGRRVLRRGSGATWAVLARGGTSDRPFDIDHPALVWIEPDVVGVAPAAEDLVVDLEDPRSRRVLLRVLREDALHDGPEAVLREQVLRR